jgi:hypothetical protein
MHIRPNPYVYSCRTARRMEAPCKRHVVSRHVEVGPVKRRSRQMANAQKAADAVYENRTRTKPLRGSRTPGHFV